MLRHLQLGWQELLLPGRPDLEAARGRAGFLPPWRCKTRGLGQLQQCRTYLWQCLQAMALQLGASSVAWASAHQPVQVKPWGQAPHATGCTALAPHTDSLHPISSLSSTQC